MALVTINKVRIAEGREILEMTNIETISLPDNEIDEFPLVKYSSLVRLYLQGNALSGVIDLTGCVNIQYFSINGNSGITDIGIGDIPDFANLRYLDSTGTALNQSTVDYMLEALDTSGVLGGLCYLNGGSNAAPSVTGQGYVTSLESKSWDVRVN